MAEINIKNSGISGSTGTTDLTGYGFTDNPIISNYLSREQYPGDLVDTAIPLGSQENFSLNMSQSPSGMYIEGNLDPVPDNLIAGDEYTAVAWVKLTDLAGIGIAPGEYAELINTRPFGGGGPPAGFREVDDVNLNTPDGFTIGVVNTGGSYYWAINVNGDATEDAGTAITENSWYWVVLRKDSLDIKFYALESTPFTDTGLSSALITDTLAGIGGQVNGAIKVGHSDSTSDYVPMQILDLQIWDQAISGNDLQDAQYTILTPPQAELSGLKWYYRFNPDFNNIVKDSNFGKNNFIAVNFEGNPFVQESPIDMGDNNLRSLEFAGNDEYLWRADNSNDSGGTIAAPGVFYGFESSYAFEFWVNFNTLPNAGGEKMGIFSKFDSQTSEYGLKMTVEYLTDGTHNVGAGEDGAYFVFQSNGGTTSPVGANDDLGPVIDYSNNGNDGYAYIYKNGTTFDELSTGVWYYVAVVKDATGSMNAGTKNYHFFATEDNSGGLLIDDVTSDAFTIIGDELARRDLDFLVGAEHADADNAPANFLDAKLIMFRGFKSIRTQAQIATYRNTFLNF